MTTRGGDERKGREEKGRKVKDKLEVREGIGSDEQGLGGGAYD